MKNKGWQFCIDRGGTFTDIIGEAPDGTIVVRKLLSDNTDRYADAAVAGIDEILKKFDASRQPGSRSIDAIKMGTTVATNALLERRGEPVVLIITKGFGDALRIGYQNRPEIFARHIVLPEPLYDEVVEVQERVDVNGKIVLPIDTLELEDSLQRLYRKGYRSCAICFLHAYRFVEHERIAGEIARSIGFVQVSMSHEVSPLRKLISRGDTAVADAYLSPVLKRYIEGLEQNLKTENLRPDRLMFMQSNGGLVNKHAFRGKDSILSGPAGGVVGMVAASGGAGRTKLIGFDMGGTSTDVSLFSGDFEYVTDNEIAGVRIRSPMIRIHTIAAGGGSILKFDSGRFQVGPESAGADPGPASYRKDGPLTVTDANVMLGRVLPKCFPRIFGPDGDDLLDRNEVVRRFSALAGDIGRATGRQMRAEDVAEGFILVAANNMANAIKRVSVRRGYDPGEFTLCCFGGAGGQHACRVADQLGIRKILIHPLAGVLSAYGIGMAPLSAYRQQTIEAGFDRAAVENLEPIVERLSGRCRASLGEQGVPTESCRLRTICNIKVTGADTTLPILLDTPAAMLEAFRNAHRLRYGFNLEGAALQIESLRVEATGDVPGNATREQSVAFDSGSTDAPAQARLFCNGRWHRAPIHRRTDLHAGTRISGPAIIVEDTATTVLDPGWQLDTDETSHLVMTRHEPVLIDSPPSETTVPASDPVRMEIFSSHFMNIAEEMGAVLENTAHSVNIKERLDFSCALFDRSGNLIASAPHIPVHLGAMGDTVRAVLSEPANRIRPGDVYMLNSPYHGGSHLPDITVVTPVFDSNEKHIVFLVACRAHHADIGGISPGSMPPRSQTIHDEGVLFDCFKLVTDDQFSEKELIARLTEGPHPARNPGQNVADLRAQAAANEHGVRALRAMTDHFGLENVLAYMDYIQANAEESVRSVVDSLDDGEFVTEMDGGEVVRVRLTIDRNRREALIDFSGTSPQSPSNLNAPLSVTRAAVLYVFRTLITANIPLNAGCMKPLKLIVPKGCLLNPEYPAAVVAGNVETSQCITNTLYGALKVMAASPGTMNNLTFGNDRFQYYETICGGSGAGPGFDGTDAVHTHMTNSRMTDPEVLEARYPIFIREFSVRRNSGGEGLFHGGCGVVRRIEFREPMEAAILSNNRRTSPVGMDGGGPGRPGSNFVIRHTGEIQKLGGVDEITVEAGDVLVIETPGGGGYGAPQTSVKLFPENGI